MTTHKPQPADPLELAILFATLALAACPDRVRQAMIRVLDDQITPLDEARFDQLLQQLEDPDCDLDSLGVSPAIARWLRDTSPNAIPPTDLCLLPAGDLPDDTN